MTRSVWPELLGWLLIVFWGGVLPRASQERRTGRPPRPGCTQLPHCPAAAGPQHDPPSPRPPDLGQRAPVAAHNVEALLLHHLQMGKGRQVVVRLWVRGGAGGVGACRQSQAGQEHSWSPMCLSKQHWASGRQNRRRAESSMGGICRQRPCLVAAQFPRATNAQATPARACVHAHCRPMCHCYHRRHCLLPPTHLDQPAVALGRGLQLHGGVPAGNAGTVDDNADDDEGAANARKGGRNGQGAAA